MARSFSEKVAVVLIYQPKALLESLIFELEHLNRKGLSTILVANHPLSDADLARLKPLCHLIMQRPNVGYDFGGYRDGILRALQLDVLPKSLFVLNDSVWFPLSSNCTLIDQALQSTANIFGIFFNTKNRQMKHHHLQSYFYRFDEKTVSDPRFLRFWQKLPLYSDKRMVIRKCEIALAGHFSKRGCSVDALVKPKDILLAGHSLTDAEFLTVAQYHTTTSLRGRSIFGSIIKMSPSESGWKEARRKCIEHSRFKYYFIDAHPIILFGKLRAPFLKKSREFHYYPQRDAVIGLGYDSSFDTVIREEIRHWNDSGVSAPPESSDFVVCESRSNLSA